jgi:hypothetical protein
MEPRLLTLVQLLPTALVINGGFGWNWSPTLGRKEDPGFNEDETEEGLSSVFATCFSSVNENPKSLQLLLHVETRSGLLPNVDRVARGGRVIPSGLCSKPEEFMPP